MTQNKKVSRQRSTRRYASSMAEGVREKVSSCLVECWRMAHRVVSKLKATLDGIQTAVCRVIANACTGCSMQVRYPNFGG